jgi:hypothetical protein
VRISVTGLLVLASLAACAATQHPATTTVTSAEVDSSPATEKAASPSATAPEAAPSSDSTPSTSAASTDSTSAPEAEAPAGQLVCKAKGTDGVIAELYLEWKGTMATGTIRRTAPSGMLYLDPIRAERYNSTIVVDTPNNDDLASHAALVASKDGRQYMRVGDVGQPWLRCE